MCLQKVCFCLLVCVCSACAWSAAVADETHAHHPEVAEQLGKVSFPISCAAESRRAFERGVALLHSFGYEEAEQQFAAVVQKDPSCAIAHWGIAMSMFHQIWERPDESTLKRGNEEIAKAQATDTKSERERDYISALAVFYRDPAQSDYLKRVKAYSDAMAVLYQHYPTDIEAGAFYALSLLASQPPDETSHESEKKAVAVLNKLFQQEPDHPGLAHYIIHACDSPQMAPAGLEAARRYASIASSSAHAVHMPSHIFARLGLWQEDIQANLKSVALAHASEHVYMHGHELHAMHFLIYAYLQTGHDDGAKQVMEQSKQIIAQAPTTDQDSGMLQYYGYAAADFPALYHLEMRHWSDAMALEPPPGSAPHIQTITYWARTIAAAHLGDLEATRLNARRYDELEDAVRKTKYAYVLEGPNIARSEVHAWLAFAEKRSDEAVRQMQEAADTQDKVGKGEVAIPAREMLADLLLALNRPQEALAQYELSLKVDPNRFNGLAGAAHAAEVAKQPEKAVSYYQELLKNCDYGKHSNRPELSHARLALAKIQQ